jgi:hypothetical protein
MSVMVVQKKTGIPITRNDFPFQSNAAGLSLLQFIIV